MYKPEKYLKLFKPTIAPKQFYSFDNHKKSIISIIFCRLSRKVLKPSVFPRHQFKSLELIK